MICPWLQHWKRWLLLIPVADIAAACATQIWEPLAQVTTAGWIPLWYYLSQPEFWETVATCSLHDTLLNKQLLFCLGFSVRVISLYGPTLSALQWSDLEPGDWKTAICSSSYIQTESVALRDLPIYWKYSPTQQKHHEKCLCLLRLT